MTLVEDTWTIAVDVNATPAQRVPARLLAQGDYIAPVPGTKRVARVDETPLQMVLS